MKEERVIEPEIHSINLQRTHLVLKLEHEGLLLSPIIQRGSDMHQIDLFISENTFIPILETYFRKGYKLNLKTL